MAHRREPLVKFLLTFNVISAIRSGLSTTRLSFFIFTPFIAPKEYHYRVVDNTLFTALDRHCRSLDKKFTNFHVPCNRNLVEFLIDTECGACSCIDGDVAMLFSVSRGSGALHDVTRRAFTSL